MLSSKFICASLRGAGVRTSNQLGPAFSKPSLGKQAPGQNISVSDHSLRTLLTASRSGGYLAQAARASKMQKMDITSLEPDINLPQRPKRPITPWLAFVRDKKDDVLKQKDKMTAAELAVVLAKEWKQTDKSRYQEEYDRQQQDYHRKLEEYNNSLTEEHRDYLVLQKKFNREHKAEKQLRKTKPPVLPRNPANLYCQERSKHADVKDQMKHRKPANVFSDIFKEYRELSECEKKKYLEMQEEDKSRFQHEFLVWYESIQNNENLTKATREKADALRARFKSLNYI